MDTEVFLNSAFIIVLIVSTYPFPKKEVLLPDSLLNKYVCSTSFVQKPV